MQIQMLLQFGDIKSSVDTNKTCFNSPAEPLTFVFMPVWRDVKYFQHLYITGQRQGSTY